MPRPPPPDVGLLLPIAADPALPDLDAMVRLVRLWGAEAVILKMSLVGSPGDVDGDGRADALVDIGSGDPRETRTWLDVVPALAEGLVDHRSRVLASDALDFCEDESRAFVPANLDGDGQADLVYGCDDRLAIWFGRDLYPDGPVSD